MFEVCILQFSIRHCVIIKYMLNIQNFVCSLKNSTITTKILLYRYFALSENLILNFNRKTNTLLSVL